MKKLLLILLVAALPFSAFAQSKKEQKEAEARALFEKAVAVIDSKDWVIVPDSYKSQSGTNETNTDDSNFISYENGEHVFLQGGIVCSNGKTNRMTVESYEQKYDKKGNLVIIMQVTGTMAKGRIDILLPKGSNYAEVTVNTGQTRYFSGELVARKQARYYKRPNVV